MLSPCIPPTPRSFNHTNRSNNLVTWGGKYESQCVTSINIPTSSNILLGDSHFERLARPAHSSLLQDHLPNWVNFGIGGDRAEHVAWRALHGSCPDKPANILFWMGSNNLNAAASFQGAKSAANTILNAVRSIQSNYPSTKISMIGILPQRCAKRTEAGMQINNILKFRLPPSVTFIASPFEHWNSTYFSDDVHLNTKGYEVLFKSQHFLSLIHI